MRYWIPFAGEPRHAKDPVAFEKWIQDTSTPKNVIATAPDLSSDIRTKLDALLNANKIVAWENSRTQFPSGYELLALNADATHAVASKSGKWSIVELNTGGVRDLCTEPFDPQNKLPAQYGPWMSTESDRVIWISEGRLRQIKLGESEPTDALKDTPKKIVVADLTPSFQHIVLAFEDSQIERWNAQTGSTEVLVIPRSSTPLVSEIRTALDGQALVYTKGNGLYYSSFRPESIGNSRSIVKDNAKPASKFSHYAALLTSEPIGWSACSTTTMFAAESASPRVCTLVHGGPTMQPSRRGAFPLPGDWVTSVDIGGKEFLQVIGKQRDPVSQKDDLNFVFFSSPGGEWTFRQYQAIHGKLDKRARMASNGSAIAHFRGDELILSKRPQTAPLSLSSEIVSIGEKLLADRDIGQLEALLTTLETEPFLNVGPYPGWLSGEFVRRMTIMFYWFQPQLPGDRELRAQRLAIKLRKQFPKSQFASVVLGNLCQSTAWTARGQGTINTVTEEGMELFRTSIRRAGEAAKPFLNEKACAATYMLLIDVARAEGDMALLKQLSVQLMTSKFNANAQLHQSITFTLLPRWHGAPGDSEAYRDSVCNRIGGKAGDALYTQLSTLMHSGAQMRGGISKSVGVDLERFISGAFAYYGKSNDPELMDLLIFHLGLEQRTDSIVKLLELRHAKQIPPGMGAIQHAADLSVIEHDPQGISQFQVR